MRNQNKSLKIWLPSTNHWKYEISTDLEKFENKPIFEITSNGKTQKIFRFLENEDPVDLDYNSC